MMVQKQQPLLRALRRSHSSLAGSNSSNNKTPSSSSSSSWIHLRSVLFVVASSASSPMSSDRGSQKSSWSNRRRKHALLAKQWKSLFDVDGKLSDGGVKFLKKVRSGGVEPSIRGEVWPFLLGMYDVKSSKKERITVRARKRREYMDLRRQCRQISKRGGRSFKLGGISENHCNEDDSDNSHVLESSYSDGVASNRPSLSMEGVAFSGELTSKGFAFSGELSSKRDTFSGELTSRKGVTFSGELTSKKGVNFSGELTSKKGVNFSGELTSKKRVTFSGELTSKKGVTISGELTSKNLWDHEEEDGVITDEIVSEPETESSGSDSSIDLEDAKPLSNLMETGDYTLDGPSSSSPCSSETKPAFYQFEDFTTWQRIIRLDAIRANEEWIIYSPSQAEVSLRKAQRLAESVGLKDYDNLEPCKIYHAARLVAILEAYAVYDSEIGYCQGMSDLLSPIISVIEDDDVAFWCFVGFMHKARHNFRLDEVGIRRQLSIVSKIIKCKDSHLYKHLEKLEADDCFFVYRMVVVLFRRELTFEQTLCLWEVMWADQAAIRAGFSKPGGGIIKCRAPPTDDLLLYAIAACVLQKKRLIIEKYSSMDEIMKECNGMAGQLDVWKLLDDAHDLVVTLHEKI